MAIYFDKDTPTNIKWTNQYFHDVWVYVKEVYGQFGDDPRLYAVFHTGKYIGGHSSTYFDYSHNFKNVIDCGKDNWTAGALTDLDWTLHQVGRIVEGQFHAGLPRGGDFPKSPLVLRFGKKFPLGFEKNCKTKTLRN